MDINAVLKRNFPKMSKEYESFAQEKDKCRRCPIYNHYEQVGQSEGNAEDPVFMFVGEALGRDEVEQIRPFIGMAGQRLRSELRKHKCFKRDTALISNILACRPLNNKFPQTGESNKCANHWLRREIHITRPKFIIALGNPSMRYFLGEHSITAARGNWKFSYDFRAWTFATFHPSYVIRSEKQGNHQIVQHFVNDIKKVADDYGSMVDDDRLSLTNEEWNKCLVAEAWGDT